MAQHGTPDQLEAVAVATVEKLKAVRKQLKSLSQRLHATQQESQLLAQTTQRTAEALKDANWQFTREAAAALRKLKTPTPALATLAAAFLGLLEQRDTSWKTFQAVLSHYTPVKNLMSGLQLESLTAAQLQALQPLCETREEVRRQLAKHGTAPCLLVDWLCAAGDWHVQTASLHTSKSKAAKLQQRCKKLRATTVQLTEELLAIEEAIQQGEAEASRTSTLPEDTCAKQAPVALATASGGRPEGFPNFEREDLYQEVPAQDELILEGPADSVGCCRLKFFCF